MVPNVIDLRSKFAAIDTYIFDEENVEDLQAEEINLVEHFTPWQESFETDYNRYCTGISESTDEYILEFFAHEFPDNAIPILRKGTPYDLFSRLYDLEKTYDATGLCVWPDTLIHIYGRYYEDKYSDDHVNKYCLKCFRDDISYDADEVRIYEFHQCLQGDVETCSEITNPYRSSDYWCHNCDRFLFEIADIDIISFDCNSCIPNIPLNKHTIFDANTFIFSVRVNPRTFPYIDERWPVV